MLTTSLALLTVIAPAKFNLEPQAHMKQEMIYAMTMRGKDGKLDLSIEGALARKVTKVFADKSFEIETTSKGVVLQVGAESVQDNRPLVVRTKHSSRGMVLSSSGTNDQESMKLAYFTNFVSPGKSVDIGDQWKVSYDASKSQPGVELNFKVVGTQKIGKYQTVKVEMSGKETSRSKPASATGEFFIRQDDGFLDMATIKFKNKSQFDAEIHSYSLKRV